ncbi:thiamine-phosphate diphosphorylase [Thioalkalivibrio denitrificans]|uniref:Thiamine-phosphate synthase n=1 Tax=Thioalkalivibrio denitrificans TaxID=108003 RepID=A0A1V3NAL5_9GAMM|nr:thiamine phosphate synthase [Thioalkalivibrio denitrificans]OOG21928.1 thiamine-phosphate diphosphorylase [Thioalkalivibrio denitrificans]
MTTPSPHTSPGRAGSKLRGLYVITPDGAPDAAQLQTRVTAALRGGARIVQYRDKSGDHGRRLETAHALRELCEAHAALLIINDDAHLAHAIDAHGVHLGQQDMPLEDARALLGPEAVIGITCHERLDRAIAAELGGADYVAFGAAFPSPTKPDAARVPLMLFAQAREVLNVPVCAIGGITAENASEVITAGADMVAVSSGVFDRPDPEAEAEARRLAALFRAGQRYKVQG